MHVNQCDIPRENCLNVTEKCDIPRENCLNVIEKCDIPREKCLNVIKKCDIPRENCLNLLNTGDLDQTPDLGLQCLTITLQTKGLKWDQSGYVWVFPLEKTRVCLFVCAEILRPGQNQWGHVECGQFT